jgi:diadenosine tetraphosphatase ApaH/serine/threonine PP2A family protein phosphatase
VCEDLESQGVDEVWCGGDLAWGGPWASECIERVRAAGWPTVRGNTDVWITGDPQTVASDEDRRRLQSMADAHAISPDDARWLVGLPLGHSGPGSLLLVHATPQSPFVGPLPDAPAAEFQPFENQAAVVVYGHVHRAFVRRLADGTIVCNSGAVGFPMDAESACYLVIDRNGPEWTLVHRRVAFDRAAVIAEARRRGGPIQASVERFLSG